MVAPVSGDGSAGFDELFLQFSKADCSLFRIRAGSCFVFTVVIHVGVVTVIVRRILRSSAAHGGRRNVVRVVQVACDQVAEPPLISVDQCIFIEYVLYGAGEQRHGFHQLA